MNDLNDLSFEELIKKMNEIQQIEINWRENKNPSQLRNSIRNLGFDDLNYLEENVDDPKSLAMIVQLYYWKFFAVINMRVKDMIMSFKNDPSKLMELQQNFKKIFNVDFSDLDFGKMFGGGAEDYDVKPQSEPKDKPKESSEHNKKLN